MAFKNDRPDLLSERGGTRVYEKSRPCRQCNGEGHFPCFDHECEVGMNGPCLDGHPCPKCGGKGLEPVTHTRLQDEEDIL